MGAEGLQQFASPRHLLLPLWVQSFSNAGNSWQLWWCLCTGQWLCFLKFHLKDIYWFYVSYVFLRFCWFLDFFLEFYFNRLESKVWRTRTRKGKSMTFLSGSWKPERLPVHWQICKELNLSTFIWCCKQDLNAALGLWLLFWLLLSIIHYLLHVTLWWNHMYYFCYVGSLSKTGLLKKVSQKCQQKETHFANGARK